MTTLLTDNLPLLAGAPNGIKKLRELILELAVRGKLVQQEPNDEPASELLKRIDADKARLVAEGKIKKQKVLADIGEEEKPFNVPTNWEWVRVASVGHDWGQKTPDKAFTYIDVGAVDNAAGRISTPQILMAENAPSRARKVVRPGTVIYSTIRPYLLNVAVIAEAYKQEPIASTAFAIIHPYLKMPARYFLYYLRSPVFVRYVESVQMGIAYPAINDGQFFSGLIPLPPLAEQHRIVAKVDELMALCDRLEAHQADAENAHAQLVQALLDSLTQASDATAFAANWQRLAEHFHILFTTEPSIDALKQTLLQLAVMGKLVPQDPNDEPASELLKRITEETTRLVAERKLKKQKPLDEISQEQSFRLPVGWEWVRLGRLSHIKGGKRLPAGATFSPKETPHIYIQVTNMKGGTITKHNLKFIDEATQAAIKQYTISKDDLYITIAGTIGDIGVIPDHFDGMNLTENAAKIVFQKTDKHWLKFALSSQFVQHQFSDSTNQLAQPKLALHRIADVVLALPPISEQHRIVVKIDQLMDLCDQLKISLTQARQFNEQLASALVEQAVA